MIQVIKCPSCAAPLEIDGNRIERCSFCGSRLAVSPNNVVSPGSFEFDGLLSQAQKLKEILHLARSDRKIEAIKIYRETFGSGLAEAKDAVENLIAGNRVDFTDFQIFSVNSPLNQTGKTIAQSPKIAEIRQELRLSHKLNAIKIYRETFGGGLKEAKDAVESLERGENPQIQVNKFLQFNTQPRAKSSNTVIWLIVTIIFVALAALLLLGGIAIFSGTSTTKNSRFVIPTPIMPTQTPVSAQNLPPNEKVSYATEILRFVGAEYFRDN